MKLGLIVECACGGPDELVFRCLIERFWGSTHVVHRVAAMVHKGKLIAEAGAVAATMMAQGCDLVLVVWDLHPGWAPPESLPRKGKVKRDCVVEANHVRRQIDAAGVPREQLLLLCIDDELESVLLADEAAIKAIIAQELKPRRAKPLGKSVADRSKDTLDLRFEEQGLVFFDREHDVRILREAKAAKLLATEPLQRLSRPDKLGAPVSDRDCAATAKAAGGRP